MKIYILTENTYDYYEFTDVVFVHTDKEKVIKYYESSNNEYKLIQTSEEAKSLLDEEEAHYFLEVWEDGKYIGE